MKHFVRRRVWITLLALVAGIVLFKPLYAQDEGGMSNGEALTASAVPSATLSAGTLPNGWTVINADGYTRWRLEGTSICQFDDHKYGLPIDVDPAKMSDIRLTMSNYDVDYFDPQECEGGPEFDNADLNGQTLGILAGANNSWSLNSWSLDRSALVKGTNRIDIDTDATGTGCWCVAVGYIELQAKVGFQVIETTPTDSEQNRDFHANKLDLTVTFSTDVDASTVNNDTFTVGYRNPAGQLQPVPGSFTLVAPNKFRFEPNSDLLDGVTYYGKVNSGPGGVKSAGGIELEATYIWSFSTVPNLDLTDTYEYNDLAGSRCPPSTTPCRGLEIAVFQVSRNATMVPNKDAVARIYLRWKRHSEVFPADLIKELTVKADLNIMPDGGSYSVVQTVKRPDQYSDAEINGGLNTLNIYHKPPSGFNYSVTVTPQPQSNVTPVVFNGSKALNNAGKSPTITFDHYFLKDGEWLSGVPSGIKTDALNLLATGAQITLDQFPVVAVNAVNKGDLTIGYTYTGVTVNRASCGMVKQVMCPVGATTITTTEPDCVDFKMRTLLGGNKIVAITIPQSVCPNVGGVAFGHVFMMPPTNNAVAIAHEIGHAYGISTANNPNSGHRNSPDGIEGFQVRTRTNRSQIENPNMAQSLMHTGPVADSAAQWIHNDDYATLFGTVTLAQIASIPAGVETPLATPYLKVSGMIDVAASSAQMEPLFLQADPLESPAPGSCTAELFDGSSAVLASASFTPGVAEHVLRTSGEVQDEDVAPDSTDAGGPQAFAITLPWNENAQALQISCGGSPLVTVSRSAAAPTADFSDLANDASLSGNVTVNWTGSDGDSSDLFYQLQFSEDGASWTPLTPLQVATTQSIDTTIFPSGNTRNLRLLVTDGFNTVFVVRTVKIINPLMVLGQDPPDFGVNVGLNTTIQAVFNTPIDPNSLSIATFSVVDGLDTVTGTVTLTANPRVVSFKPSVSLEPSAYYTVRVRATLKDISGYSLPFDSVWSFQTVSDTVPPLIDRMSPADGESNVPINNFIMVHLNEDLNFASTNNAIVVTDSQSHPVEGSTSYYDKDDNLVFIPKEKLAPNTTYQVTVPATVTDENGNPLEKARVWSFTTSETESRLARIVGNYGELAQDLNGDGLYDTLTVYVDVQSLSSIYNLNARLLDKSGQLIQWTKAEFDDSFFAGLLDQGLHRLALTFDGKVIRAHQVDGPYFVDSLNFYDTLNPLNADTRFEVFQTLPYDVTLFDGILSFKPLPDRLLEWNTTRDNAWNLRDYVISLAAPTASVTYAIIGNSDPRVGASIDADNNVDIHPDPNVETESTITIEARDGLGNRGVGSFTVRVQKPAATFLVVPSILVLPTKSDIKIDVEIQDQFEHLFSGEAVELTFDHDLASAKVAQEKVTTSSGHASVTYSTGPDVGTDSLRIHAGSGLNAIIEIVIGNDTLFLPDVENIP